MVKSRRIKHPNGKKSDIKWRMSTTLLTPTGLLDPTTLAKGNCVCVPCRGRGGHISYKGLWRDCTLCDGYGIAPGEYYYYHYDY